MERAMRYSKKREAILAALRGTRTHPTAEWIYQTLKPEHQDLSLGTVYRNLALFQRQGLVRSVGVVDGHERFDAFTAPHSHFVCSCCRSVIDLPELLPDSGTHDIPFRGQQPGKHPEDIAVHCGNPDAKCDGCDCAGGVLPEPCQR